MPEKHWRRKENEMDNRAFFDLTYGLFLIGARAGEKENACITNTVMQVAASPTRVTLACINGNYTPELIKEGGYFTAGIIDDSVDYDYIENFGLKHGRDIDKFQGYEKKYDGNGIPFLNEHVCSVLSCRVISCQDLGTHTLFIAEVVDAVKISENRPVTYAEYFSRIKPQKKEVKDERKIIGWRCRICGFTVDGPELPDDYRCPLCDHPRSDFEPIYEE